LFEGKPKHTLAIIKAHFAFYCRFSKIQRARAATSKHPFKKLSDLTGTYSGSMVWQVYAKGKSKFSEFY